MRSPRQLTPQARVSSWAAFLAGGLGIFGVLAPNSHLLPSALSFYDTQRLLQLALLYALTTGLLGSSRFRGEWLNAWSALPSFARTGLFSFIVLGTASALLAPRPGYGLLEVTLYFSLLCLVLAVAALYRRHPSILSVQATTAILSAGLLLYLVPFASGVMATRAEGVAVPLLELFHSFGNIRVFNDYLTWVLPLIVLPGVLLPRSWHILRGLAWLTAAAGWMLLIASASRGGILAFSVAAVVVTIAFRSQAKRWLQLQALVIVAGTLLYWLIFHLPAAAPEGSSIAARSAHFFEDAGRIKLWGAALDMINTHPILGAGPMHFAYYAQGMHASPHSAPFQIAAEWGLPAAFIAFGLAIWAMLAWVRGCRQKLQVTTDERRLAYVALTAALTAGSVQSFVSGVIVGPISQILMAVLVGWALAWHTPHPTSVRRQGIGPHLAASAGLMLAFAMLVWKPLIASPPLPVPDIRMGGEFHPPIFTPRFWTAGSIAPTPCSREPWLAKCPRPDAPRW